MESFYAGPQGQSIVIKERFSSIEEMTAKFNLGRSYTDVWFGEYCLIATTNINDGHNGMMFRRGLNYNGTWGGAEYIGQFVGPSSGTPFFDITSFENVDSLFNTKKNATLKGADSTNDYPDEISERYRYLPDIVNNDAEADAAHNVWGDGVAFDEDGLATTEKIFDKDVNLKVSSYNVNNALVSGKTNNDIKFKWFNVRTNNASSDSWIHVGFQIPFPEFLFTGTWGSPYYEDGDERGTTGTIKSSEHGIRFFEQNTYTNDKRDQPFYNQWQVEIPRGIKGDTLRNLRIVKVSAVNTVNDNGININVYDWKDILAKADKTDQHLVYTDLFDTNQTPHVCKLIPKNFYTIDANGKETTIPNIGAEVLIVDLLVYDYTNKPKAITAYLGFIKNIKDVTFIDGILKIEYTDGTSISWPVDYITNIEINDDNGQVTFVHSLVDHITTDGLKVYKKTSGNRLNWVKDIHIAKNGQVYLETTGSDSKDVKINEDENIYYQRTDPLAGTVIKYIDNIAIGNNKDSDQGRVTITYNTGETYNRVIHSVNNIDLATGLRDDKRVKITYNEDTGDGRWTTSSSYIGNPINDIEASFINGVNYHLYVLWSDQKSRPNDEVIEESPAATKWANRKWLINANKNAKDIFGTDMSNSDYEGLYWQDMGAVKDQAGILVGYHLTNEIMRETIFSSTPSGGAFTAADGDVYSNERIIEFLNLVYPTGTNNDGLPINNENASRIVVYSPTSKDNSESEKRKFFAFDYNTNSWFYLGTFGQDNQRDVYIWDGAENDANLSAVLRSNGVALYRQKKPAFGTLTEMWKN
ncbi:MAG TPA: hypothetical protein DCW90_18345 [Lachnospiraceae bacterium]|nr:hypothetical protein [Lachnospiraceae bacterium]